MANKSLGRLIPKDFSHVQKSLAKDVLPATVDVVNKHLPLPSWHWQWDQGQEGACVGYGESMMKTITELAKKSDHRYDPRWLWTEAKTLDGFTHTDPNDGTTLHAGCQVLQTIGHKQVHPTSHPTSEDSAPDLNNGIQAVRWATSIDEIRTTIALGIPVAIGINWYSAFDNPQVKWLTSGGLRAYWIGLRGWDQTEIRGGHCVCVYAAYDKWQGVKIKNSWGHSYPIVYMPYDVLDTLLNQDGEAALITDH